MIDSRVPTGPEIRGRLVVARRVVEKVATRVAAELTAPVDGGHPPRVDVQLDGSQTRLLVEVGLGYPVPLAATTARLRDQLADRVERLCGVSVQRVDLRVTRLAPAADTVADLA